MLPGTDLWMIVEMPARGLKGLQGQVSTGWMDHRVVRLSAGWMGGRSARAVIQVTLAYLHSQKNLENWS